MRRSLGTKDPGPAELEIGRMRRRHLRGIMAIERQVYPRPWSPSLFIAEKSDPSNRSYIVARIGRDVVGYAGMICYGDEAHVTTIAVDPVHQRRKIATRLLSELIETAIEMGARAVSLEVRVSNWSAQRLYSRFGFRPVGVRKGYYQETGEDALIMWTDDINRQDYRRQLELISSQAHLHERFGGVVPEVASRAHLENINPLITMALTEAGVWFPDIDAVAVTVGPGLVGALLVGLAAAKAIALALEVPFIGVSHLEGHIYANFLAGRG